MSDPHPEFSEAMLDIYRNVRKKTGYPANYFLNMLGERHGYDTAIHLIQSTNLSTGFLQLYEKKSLDLTVEALVLQPQWRGLFNRDDLLAARNRLEQYNFGFNGDYWDPDDQGEEDPPPTPQPGDFEAPPTDRTLSTTYRILRDTELARKVKKLHGYRCQICSSTIQLPDGTFYAEAHHIQPLGRAHNGPDTLGNIACLCPNHHAELDYLVREIDLSSWNTVDSHVIDPKFVEHHNRRCQGLGQ